MELMAEFTDNYFDLAIVDPPYGIGAENHAGKKENWWKQWQKKEWDNSIPSKEYFDELFRVSKNQIIWGGNYMIEYLNPSMGWIVWDKGQRSFSLADGELAWTSFNKAMRIWEYSRAKTISQNKIHPTQKPKALYKWLLQNYAKEGDKILDTHLGSGSIAIACHEMGFDLTGCELDKDYFEAMLKRIEIETAQGDLFL
jgi:site-specific DNA-methyltransferase (adenine-specific)